MEHGEQDMGESGIGLKYKLSPRSLCDGYRSLSAGMECVEFEKTTSLPSKMGGP